PEDPPPPHQSKRARRKPRAGTVHGLPADEVLPPRSPPPAGKRDELLYIVFSRLEVCEEEAMSFDEPESQHRLLVQQPDVLLPLVLDDLKSRVAAADPPVRITLLEDDVLQKVQCRVGDRGAIRTCVRHGPHGNLQ